MATDSAQVLEQQWYGRENFVAYLTTKDKFDTVDQAAASLFKLAHEQMASLLNASGISNDLMVTMKTLYSCRTAGALSDTHVSKLMTAYEKLIAFDKKAISTVFATLDAAKDDYEFAVESLRGKIQARDDKLQECLALHDQQQKALKKSAKETKGKPSNPTPDTSVVDLQADLDRAVGELRLLSKVVLDGVNDFLCSYTDWFDALLGLHLKLKCSLRLVAVDDVGSKLISDLESDVSQLADTIAQQVHAARDAESVLLLDQAIPVDRCLNHPLILAHYRAYMREQLAEESLNFLLRIIQYRNEADENARRAAAHEIYGEFLVTSSPKEVNLAGSIIDGISKNLDSANPELFRDAERSVLYTLQTDTWRRFILSPQFQALQRRSRALQEANTPHAIRTKASKPEAAPETPGRKPTLGRTISSGRLLRQVSSKLLPKRTLSAGNMVSISPAAAPAGDTSELEIPDNIAKQELLLLSDNMRRSLNEEATSDVTFVVGSDSKEFYAHKLILSARCPLLLRTGSAKGDNRLEIQLRDVTPRAFKYFLEYIYTGTLPALTVSVLQELVSLASQVHLPHLEELCGTLAVARASVIELASQINQLFPTVPAPHSDDYPKYEAILSSMASRAHELLSCPPPQSRDEEHPFYDMYKGHLVKLFERDDLVIDAEIELFEFAVNWGQRHTNPHSRLQELKPLLDVIRFTQMSADDLRIKVEPTLLVSDSVLLEAYRFKSTGACSSAARARGRKYRYATKKTAPPPSRSTQAPSTPTDRRPSPAQAAVESPRPPTVAATPAPQPVVSSNDIASGAPQDNVSAPVVRVEVASSPAPTPRNDSDEPLPSPTTDATGSKNRGGQSKKDAAEPKQALKEKEKEKEKGSKKGIRQFLKRTSEFLSGTGKPDKKDKKADASKRETLTTQPVPKDAKRMSAEFKMTKVDFGADGREHELTVSAEEEKISVDGKSLTPSSSATSVADHTSAQEHASSVQESEQRPSDGSIAKADVALVDAILQEVQTEMDQTVQPVNTTSTEEDEDDFASRQQMMEARRNNRAFTTIAKPSAAKPAVPPKRAKDDSSASSSSRLELDLSAVEKLLAEPLPPSASKPKLTDADHSKDHLQDIEALLKETGAKPSDEPASKGPSLADIEQLLQETAAEASTKDIDDDDASPAPAGGPTPDMGDVLDLLK